MAKEPIKMEKESQDQETHGEFTFEYTWWKGVKVTAKNMRVETYKAMFQETLSVRRSLFWLLLFTMILAIMMIIIEPQVIKLLWPG